MDVASGLTVDGEPVGADSDAQFNAYFAEQVAKGRTEPAPEEAAAEPRTPRDASRDTAAEIKSALYSPESSGPSIQDGLILAAPPERRFQPSPESERLVGEATRRLEAGEAERVAMTNELARRRAQDVFDDPSAAEHDRLAALMTLQDSAPTEYTSLIDRLDNERLSELADFEQAGFETEDEDWSNLPGEQLNSLVGQAQAHLRFAVAEDTAGRLEERIRAEKTSALKDVYGTNDPAEVERRWMQDYQDLTAFGYDTAALSPADFKKALTGLNAVREEVARHERVTTIQQAIFEAPTTDVSSGLTTLTPWGHMPMQPGFVPAGLPANFNDRVAARADAKATPVTKGEFRAAIMAPERADVSSAWTINGQPVPQAVADGSRAAWEKAERERRERAMR